jgi:hypothetical protein
MTIASLAAASSVPPQQIPPEASYEPGVCNIGQEEIDRRIRGGHLGVLATILTLVFLVAVNAPPLARILVALPAAGAAVAYLEAYFRFCVAFGSRGIFNFGVLGSFARVADPNARAKDRARAFQITLAGAAVGLFVGVVAVALPI